MNILIQYITLIKHTLKTNKAMKNGIAAALILILLVGVIIGAYHYPIIMAVLYCSVMVWGIYFVWWTIKFVLDLISNK
jgi:hypothetical protein